MQASRLKEKVRDLGEAVGPGVEKVKEVVVPKAAEVRDVVVPKAREVSEKVGPKVRETRRRVGLWIAGEEPKKARRWPAFAAAGVGAVAAFFLDPVSGKRRRAVTKDWVGARVRAAGRRAAGLGRGAAAYTSGYRNRLAHGGNEQLPENDPTLAHKVESEIFQGLPSLDISSGQININAEDGVIYLRGAVERPGLITEIERRVRDVTGVRGVVNLLHLVGTPAPTS